MKIICVLLASACLHANSVPESTSLSSSSADYNGNTLILKGNVSLDHGLGKMLAEQAFLEKQEPGKDFPFSYIRLLKEVRMTTPDAEIKCETADLDFISLKGVLLPKIQEKVTYLEKERSLRLMSDSIEIEMEKKGFDGKKMAYRLENLHAKGDVVVDYAKAFTLRADHAHYTQMGSKRILTVYPAGDEGLCHLTQEGNQVAAAQIQLDCDKSRLSFLSPSGRLLSSLVPQIKNAEMLFNAKELVWDHLKNTLSLKGNVHVEESSLGTLDTDGIIQITQAKHEGKRLLKSIRSQGKTTLTYSDPSLQEVHTLVTYGPVTLDREHMRMTIESPLQNGKVAQEKQLLYIESGLTVSADKALIEYALVDDQLQPVSLLLKGNVHVSSPNDNNQALCGLSDRILFSHATKTLILSADPSKRVLFWDEEQGLSISSQEIHVTQDPTTHKRAIKGVGSVKFAFTNEENSLLHHHFPTFKVSHE